MVEREGEQVDLDVTPVENEVARIVDGEVVVGADGEAETVQAGFLGVTPVQVAGASSP